MAGRKGLTSGEALAAALVVLLLAAIVVPIFLRVRQHQDSELDVVKMRRLFAGVAMYQEDHSGGMPANLAELHGLIESSDLVSSLDPYADAKGPFPLEPTLPGRAVSASARISYAYIGSYLGYGIGSLRQWTEATVHTGLLANPWAGNVDAKGRFEATVSGPVQRVRMDGSLYVLPYRTNNRLDDFEDLFVRLANN